MTRFATRVCALFFLTIIALPSALGLVGIRGTAIENRRLSEFPRVRPSSVIDPGFYTALSGFLNDHMALRDLVVTANSLIAVKVWRDSPNPDVHIGVNGWLFTTPFRSNCPDKMPLDVVDRLQALGRGLAASGREMRLILAPHKAAIYPEYLGAFPPSHYACGQARLNALRTRLSQIREIGFIDMEANLLRLKEGATEPLYFPKDSHWTRRAAAALSRALVESIQPGLWRDTELEHLRPNLEPMDLALLIGLPEEAPESANRSRREGITTNVIESLDCEQGSSCVIHFTSSGPPGRLIRARTIIVRDSFGARSIETLAPFFEDVTFLVWSEDVLEQLARRLANADLVVYETLDHFLFSRVDRGFTSQTIPARSRNSSPRSVPRVSAQDELADSSAPF